MTLERKWIKRLQARWPQVDLRHDTFYDPSSREIITSDMIVEGVHFSWDYCEPEDAGWKSVAVSLSDIAATGGIPRWVLVSIGVPDKNSLSRLKGIYRGIENCCQAYKCIVVGGDTVRSDKTTISVTIIGSLPTSSTPGRRDKAIPDHIVAISGPHGLSRAGLEALQNSLTGFDKAKTAHLKPIPLLRLGQRIAQILPNFSMMDSSDGLADAVLRLAETSQIDIVIEANRLLIHPEIREITEHVGADPMEWVLYGGEDFQLVVTLPREGLIVFPELQPVGFVRAASQPTKGEAFLYYNGNIVSLTSSKTFQHFAASL